MSKPKIRVEVFCGDCDETLLEVESEGVLIKPETQEHDCTFEGKFKVEMPAIKMPIQTEQAG